MTDAPRPLPVQTTDPVSAAVKAATLIESLP